MGDEAAPAPGDELAAADRLVGHAREDLDHEVVGELVHLVLHPAHLLEAAAVVVAAAAVQTRSDQSADGDGGGGVKDPSERPCFGGGGGGVTVVREKMRGAAVKGRGAAGAGQVLR